MKKTYHIIIIGCQMNKSDSERAAGYLEKLDYIWSANRRRADLVVVTTCGVRQSAEDRVYGLVPKIKKENSRCKIIITGCLSQRKDVRRRLENYVDIWLPINELPKLADKLKMSDVFRKRPTSLGGGYLNIAPKYQSKFSAFVPIGNGCDNFCAYCVVPYARGREEYRPAEEIVEEVKGLVKRGYKEIVLIAQNVNSYNFQFSILNFQSIFNFKNSNFEIDSKLEIKNSKLCLDKNEIKVINFSTLLRLINAIPGDFWIRFATSHPKDMSDELIKTIAECHKVCRHIHLPAQAGDDDVLKRMNRKYTRKHYLKLIKKIRKNLNKQDTKYKIQENVKYQMSNIKCWPPPVSITTDIIVGFPGETKKQFNNTAKLFREVKFDMAYVARYSPRPGTMAAKLVDSAPKAEKKRREEELMKILRKTALENNKKYVGKIVEVLVEEEKDDVYFGKTATFKNVKLIKAEGSPPAGRAGRQKVEESIGKFIKVKITKAAIFGLGGEMASEETGSKKVKSRDKI